MRCKAPDDCSEKFLTRAGSALSLEKSVKRGCHFAAGFRISSRTLSQRRGTLQALQ
jgi:hypothetical protein